MMVASNGECGTGGFQGPLPGDPDNNVVLSASSGFGGINVSWSYPQSNSHAVAHTVLYRGTSETYNLAIQHRIVAGNSFFDEVTLGDTFFYWIEIVSVNGTVGALIGPASATSQGLTEDLLVALTSRIDEGLLAQGLRAEIGQISTLNDNLAAEIFDRESGETSFAQGLSDVASGLAAANTFITTNENSRVTDNSAIAESLDFLAVTLGDDVASVVTNTSAWVDDISGDVGAMYTARLTVNGLVGGFGLINQGTSVEAGFDVDTFWVGRTNADSNNKPFIIDNGNVYIDNAFIRNITADAIAVNADIITTGNAIFNGNANYPLSNSVAVAVNPNSTSINGIVAVGNAGTGVWGVNPNGSGFGVKGTATGFQGIGVRAEGFGGAVALDVVGPMTISTQTISNLTVGNSNSLDGLAASNWPRIFPTNSGVANAANYGLNLTSTIPGVQSQGFGNTVNFREISDASLKKDIEDNDLGLDFLNLHRTRKYRMIADPKLVQYGMVAQEVEPIVNDSESSLVYTHEDGLKGISHYGYTAILIKAVQELSAKVDLLQEEVNFLKNQNT